MEFLNNTKNAFVETFFYERFWLPAHMTWNDFENRPDDDIYIAQPKDLIAIFPMAIFLFIARKLFESYIAYPFGKYMQVSDTKPVSATPNPTLEKLYKKSAYPAHDLIQAVCKQSDLTERTVQRWFRRRRNQDRPTTMTKFTETTWRLFYYFTIFLYGVYVLWDKPWFTDTKYCWEGFPRQHVTSDVYWYYMIELGFYLCLIFSQFADVKRKDFWEHFFHHIATILLMCFSWICNCIRAGSLVLCLHDVVDWLLEGAKINRYANNTMLCDALFAAFTVTWFVTRLIIYPVYILYTTTYEAESYVGFAYSIHLFNFLLYLLQVLHILWFIIIAKAAYRAVVVGTVEKDTRSCSEESSEDEQIESKQKHNGNGHC